MDIKKIFQETCNVDDQQMALFDRFFRLLVTENEKYNLTAIIKEEEVYEKHFLDSALVAPFIKPGATVLDIGTGAGFPGMVLALLRPDLKITMLDSNQKKIRFVNLALTTLGLTAEAVAMRAEQLVRMRQFDYVVSRAVGSLSMLLEISMPGLKVGGTCIAMKGSSTEELATIDSALKKLAITEPVRVSVFSLPSEARRSIIEYDKSAPTPDLYPRAFAQIKEKPL